MCQDQDHRKNTRSQTMYIEMKASKRKKKHPSSIALVPFLELQAIQIGSYKRPNFGGTSDPSPVHASL